MIPRPLIACIGYPWLQPTPTSGASTTTATFAATSSGIGRQVTCPVCGGSGVLMPDSRACGRCHGRGTIWTPPDQRPDPAKPRVDRRG